MPCYRCGKVQTDPARGASPWGRLVVGGEQVLICPDCQRSDPAWKDRGDRCPACGSTRLFVVMGSIICKQCGAETLRPEGPPPSH